ncbi:hypothetical protein ACQEV9_46135 [Streptomyces chartreusis]|uniref:hypothetical protein n=1 Tax=Streptomyces chartreusis TaxID=1969 RepID=UPI003D8DD70C
MDLSTPAGLEALARDVAEQLGARRTEQGGAPDRVRIIYADGRTLELAPNRPRTRITISAVLPDKATAQDLTVEPITVTARPRPRPSETQEQAAARHLTAHIRRRLTPQLTAVHSMVSPTVERARTALSALPRRTGGEQWVIADVPVVHPDGLDQPCAIVWWHTPAGASRAVAPFLADMLRRVGLVTTEPHGEAHVFFAEPPTEQPAERFHIVPASKGDECALVDQFTGACVRTYTDAEWAEGIAESANRADETARHSGACSLDLPGLSEKLIDNAQFRTLALELATAGHMPYGLIDVDYTRTPGFLILQAEGKADVARVARLLEPWGAVRSGERREAPAQEAERFGADLEAYARAMTAPGRTVAVAADGVRVTFEPAPPDL